MEFSDLKLGLEIEHIPSQGSVATDDTSIRDLRSKFHVDPSKLGDTLQLSKVKDGGFDKVLRAVLGDSRLVLVTRGQVPTEHDYIRSVSALSREQLRVVALTNLACGNIFTSRVLTGHSLIEVDRYVHLSGDAASQWTPIERDSIIPERILDGFAKISHSLQQRKIAGFWAKLMQKD